MRKKAKQIMASLLGLSLASAMLAGCGSETKPEQPAAVDEPAVTAPSAKRNGIGSM